MLDILFRIVAIIANLFTIGDVYATYDIVKALKKAHQPPTSFLMGMGDDLK